MSKQDTPDEPKDGFDLIEYPCEFNFKAMCKANEALPAVDYIRGIIDVQVEKNDLLSMHSNTSRTGKFESVTAVVKITDREQLERIYKAIADADRVVMTL